MTSLNDYTLSLCNNAYIYPCFLAGDNTHVCRSPVASSEPETVLHYEFMQDYKVLHYEVRTHIETIG